MAPGILTAILAACLLSGRVQLPGEALPGGLSVVLARTGDRVATTDATGAFGFSLPDSLGPSTVLEFWRGDRLLSSATFRFGAAKTPVHAGGSGAWWSDLLGSTRTGGDEVGHRGFARGDLGLRIRPLPDVFVDAIVTNVLDARYLDRPEADAFPQPGRSVVVQLTVGG